MPAHEHSDPFECPLGSLATGYGSQTGLFAPRIQALGHNVAISAFYGLSGAILNWNGMNIFPGGYHPYGVDVLPGHAASHFDGDLDDGLIITLIDAWVLDAPSMTRANLAAWAPVDHEPAPGHVLDFFHASGATPIAMSRNGEEAFKTAGLAPLYVPHGIDTTVYAPRDRKESRETLGIPQDAFVVGMVAANKGYPSRKGFGQAIEAFAAFRETHSDALLYLHTEMQGHVQGVNLPALLAACGVPQEAVITCDQYRYSLSFPVEYMAQAYSAIDVLLNPAAGEGFGIPVLEAQACGTPVIVSDWTAMREVGKVGWRVGGQKNYTDQRSFMLTPYVHEILAALESAYGEAGTMGEEARAHALTYDADHVTETYWRPVLEQLEVGFGLAKPEQVAA